MEKKKEKIMDFFFLLGYNLFELVHHEFGYRIHSEFSYIFSEMVSKPNKLCR